MKTGFSESNLGLKPNQNYNPNNATKSSTWCRLSLARRPGVRHVLCALQGCPQMVVGNFLAGGRIVQLADLPVDWRAGLDQGSSGRVARNFRLYFLDDVSDGRAVGARRFDVRLDDALSRHVPRHGGCAWLLRRVRHARSTACQR